MSRLRWRTVTMSIATRPVFVPDSAAWRATCATCALASSFLLGMQFTFGHDPPIHWRSTTAVRRPDRAMSQARSLPPAPLPRIRTSNRSDAAMPSSSVRRCSVPRAVFGVPTAITKASAIGPISNGGHAAIDRKIYACDEACFVRRKEQGGRRDLLRAAEPSKRNRRGELGSGLVGPFLGRRLLVEDRRVDRTWADRVDADAAVLQLGRPGADEGADCRLSGAVGGEAGDALVLGDRCDHDDRPAVIQKRQGLLDREGQAARVDRKDLVEAFLCRLGERLRIDDARPGEQDVDLALLAGDLGVEPVESGVVYGISGALWGEVTLNNGRVEQSNFNNYRVLRMNETPPIDVRLIRNSEAPGGIGEPGTSVTAAALANAVYAATGKRLRKLPLQPGLASSTR